MKVSPESSDSFLGELAEAWPERLTPDVSLLALREVDSTQRLARTLLDRHFAEQEEPHPYAVVAAAQGAGRGRAGRVWQSAAGLGVWASLALPVDQRNLQSLPMRIGVALAECVNRTLGTETCRLKWPNDLVVGRRKLGGLLVDAVSRPDGEGWAIAGFGHARVRQSRTGDRQVRPARGAAAAAQRDHGPGLPRLHYRCARGR